MDIVKERLSDMSRSLDDFYEEMIIALRRLPVVYEISSAGLKTTLSITFKTKQTLMHEYLSYMKDKRTQLDSNFEIKDSKRFNIIKNNNIKRTTKKRKYNEEYIPNQYTCKKPQINKKSPAEIAVPDSVGATTTNEGACSTTSSITHESAVIRLSTAKSVFPSVSSASVNAQQSDYSLFLAEDYEETHAFEGVKDSLDYVSSSGDTPTGSETELEVVHSSPLISNKITHERISPLKKVSICSKRIINCETKPTDSLIANNDWLEKINFKYLDPKASSEANYNTFSQALANKVLADVTLTQDINQLAIEYFVIFLAEITHKHTRPTLLALFLNLRKTVFDVLNKKRIEMGSFHLDDGDDELEDEEHEDGHMTDIETKLKSNAVECKKLEKNQKMALTKAVARAITRVAEVFFEVYHHRKYENNSSLSFDMKISTLPIVKFQVFNLEELHALAFSLKNVDKSSGKYMIFRINKSISQNEKLQAYNQKMDSLLNTFKEGPKSLSIAPLVSQSAGKKPEKKASNISTGAVVIKTDLSYLLESTNPINKSQCIEIITKEFVKCHGDELILNVEEILPKFFLKFCASKNTATEVKYSKEQHYAYFVSLCKDYFRLSFFIKHQPHLSYITTGDGYCLYRMEFQIYQKMRVYKEENKLMAAKDLRKFDLKLTVDNNREYFIQLLKMELNYLESSRKTITKAYDDNQSFVHVIQRLKTAIKELANYNKVPGSLKLKNVDWGTTDSAMYILCENYDFPLALFQYHTYHVKNATPEVKDYIALSDNTYGKKKQQRVLRTKKTYEELIAALSTEVLNFACWDGCHFFPIDSNELINYPAAVKIAFDKLTELAYDTMLRYDPNLTNDIDTSEVFDLSENAETIEKRDKTLQIENAVIDFTLNDDEEETFLSSYNADNSIANNEIDYIKISDTVENHNNSDNLSVTYYSNNSNSNSNNGNIDSNNDYNNDISKNRIFLTQELKSKLCVFFKALNNNDISLAELRKLGDFIIKDIDIS